MLARDDRGEAGRWQNQDGAREWRGGGGAEMTRAAGWTGCRSFFTCQPLPVIGRMGSSVMGRMSSRSTDSSPGRAGSKWRIFLVSIRHRCNRQLNAKRVPNIAHPHSRLNARPLGIFCDQQALANERGETQTPRASPTSLR